MPVTVIAPAVRLLLLRPLTLLAFEVRLRASVPASEPAVAAVTPTLAEAPARTLAEAPASVRRALAVVAAKSRLSW